jgi:hypothetical protein
MSTPVHALRAPVPDRDVDADGFAEEQLGGGVVAALAVDGEGCLEVPFGGGKIAAGVGKASGRGSMASRAPCVSGRTTRRMSR